MSFPEAPEVTSHGFGPATVAGGTTLLHPTEQCRQRRRPTSRENYPKGTIIRPDRLLTIVLVASAPTPRGCGS
jgi:hypothetical protein